MRKYLLVLAVAGALGVPAAAHADAVTQWNANASSAIFAVAQQPPQLSVPHLAMVHGAVYDAVNAIDGRYEGYLLTSRLATPFDSKDAAAATAAYRVLLHLFAGQQATLDAQYATSLAAVPEGMQKARGIAVGEAAAAAMIAARTNDGRFGQPGFLTGVLPGVWRPVLPAFVNDPAAWLKDVKPFLLESADQINVKGPDALASRQYAREFQEVKSVGSLTSTTRTAEQTHAARYWAENPPATWSRVLRTLSVQQGLSLTENARLFAMAYMSATDALITVWKAKADYLYWRPITAIREAETDGNPRTAQDAGWLPLINTPPYPEYPSGHTGLSGSMVAALQDLFETDEIGWTDTNAAGLTRSFSSFSQAVDEVVDARVWSGIHFRLADEDGARIARAVAKWRRHHYFGPVDD